jgi:hypothetical protein
LALAVVQLVGLRKLPSLGLSLDELRLLSPMRSMKPSGRFRRLAQVRLRLRRCALVVVLRVRSRRLGLVLLRAKLLASHPHCRRLVASLLRHQRAL